MGHRFVFALLICEDDSQYIVAVKILQELTIPPETHVTVVADSAFLADFVVDEVRRHPTWSFVSSLDSNRKITVKRYTSHAIDFGRRHLPDLQTVSIVCNGPEKHITHDVNRGRGIKSGQS